MEKIATLLELSDFRAWPDPGGLLDQNQFLIEDILLYLRLRRRISWELENPDAVEAATQEEDDLFSQDAEELHAKGIPTENLDG